MTMPPLTMHQRDQLATLLTGQLVQRRAQLALRQEGQSFVEHAVAERQLDGDEVMQRDGEREVDSALSARDVGEIASLSAALQRIGAGTYGSCIDCSASIGFERLLARPDALRCADCATRHERMRAGLSAA